MDYARRQDDRRRRVMASSVAAAAPSSTPSSRRKFEKLREARRPTVAYGSKVRGCLRGRWFSLVPITRTACVKLAFAVLVISAVLTVLHYVSVQSITVEDQPEWVSVLQITKSGSLGRYFTGLMYMGLAGASWLIYQLRRYRNDDFRGHYRLWYWATIFSLVASLVVQVPIIDMLGTAIDWSLGKRVALSGSDWLTLLMTVGGCVLMLQTIAELWRNRIALSLCLLGWACMALPIAANWNVIAIDTVPRWTVVTSGVLLASAFWFLGSVIYLRELFCEVRGIERPDGWLIKWKASAAERQLARQERREEKEAEALKAKEDAENRKANAAKAKEDARAAKEEAKRLAAQEREAAKAAKAAEKQAKRDEKKAFVAEPEPEATPEPEAKQTPQPQTSEEAAAEEKPKKRRFGLGSIMRRKGADGEDANANDEAEATQGETSTEPQGTSQDESPTSEDDIDWSSLSKSERRRLRKQLKRAA